MISIGYTQSPRISGTDFRKKDLPAFATYKADIREIENFSKEFKKYENIIIAARGGSITSFRAYFEALAKFNTKKKVYFIDTADPDYLKYVKKSCPKSKTLLIVISKSGKTVDVIENYLYFAAYKTIFVTTQDGNPMDQIAQRLKISILPHPEIGGRYSGLTATGLLPAFLIGLDIKKIARGAQKAYADFSPTKKNNAAKKLAEYINYFDRKGFPEIYMPIYSVQLQGFMELFMQLIHESVGKNGRGPTIIPVAAPESQHHSNQRYYGGRKNMQGLFLVIDKYQNKERFEVSTKVGDITLRNLPLSKMTSLKLEDSMKAEFVGNWKDSRKRGVPAAVMHLEKLDEISVGYLTGFFHYLTVYLSWLNKVNPYDQPEVETSKEISFTERFLKR
jgi:glucose-6-phosphate isomerase